MGSTDYEFQSVLPGAGSSCDRRPLGRGCARHWASTTLIGLNVQTRDEKLRRPAIRRSAFQ